MKYNNLFETLSLNHLAIVQEDDREKIDAIGEAILCSLDHLGEMLANSSSEKMDISLLFDFAVENTISNPNVLLLVKSVLEKDLRGVFVMAFSMGMIAAIEGEIS